MENHLTPQVETRELDETELDSVAGGFEPPQIVKEQQARDFLNNFLFGGAKVLPDVPKVYL